MNPMGHGKSLPTYLQRLFQNIQAVICFGRDHATVIEQEIALIASKIKHELSTPVRVIELMVEVRKPTPLPRQRAPGALLR